MPYNLGFSFSLTGAAAATIAAISGTTRALKFNLAVNSQYIGQVI